MDLTNRQACDTLGNAILKANVSEVVSKWAEDTKSRVINNERLASAILTAYKALVVRCWLEEPEKTLAENEGEEA